MKRILYSYAFLKTLADNGEDYIDSIFLPLVIRILPQENFALFEVNKRVKDEYEFEIPLNTLKLIISLGVKKGWLEQKVKSKGKKEIEGQFKLTKLGISCQDTIVNVKDTQREINTLISDIQSFFQMHNISLKDEEIFDIINNFFKKYFEPLIQYLSPNTEIQDFSLNNLDTYQIILLEYIRKIEHENIDQYRRFEKVFFGSILSALLFTDSFDEIEDLQQKSFIDFSVYLDTNVIFSLLSWHRSKEETDAARELLALLRKNKFKIRVFNFTIDEIVTVLSGYNDAKIYGKQGHIGDDIYGTFVKSGLKKTDVDQYISRIDSIIEELGIEIDPSFSINLNNYHSIVPEHFGLISTYKTMDSSYNLNHDLAAIDSIKLIRGKDVRHIEDAKAIFLTHDNRLKNFDYIELSHKDRKTICEVISDTLLTTILWVKNPGISLSISAIISAHSKSISTNWRILDHFFKEIQILKTNGKISDSDVSMLLYNNYIDHRLKEFNEGDEVKFTPEFIQGEIERAKTIIEKEKRDVAKQIDSKSAQKIQNVQNYYQHHVHFTALIIKIAILSICAIYAISCILTNNLQILQFVFFSVMLIGTIATWFFGPITELQNTIESMAVNCLFNRWQKKMDFFNK